MGYNPGPEMTTITDIERALDGHKPDLLDSCGGTPAAVALILHEEFSDIRMLLIERAKHEKDPWSGNIGFPGGKVEKTDADARMAAERETLEEIGLDLSRGRFLGRLSDIAAAHLPVCVSCFVFGVGSVGPLRLSDEVDDAFWIPLDELYDPARHGEYAIRFDGRTMTRPAIRLPQPGKPLLWGITYRLVMQFRDILLTAESRHEKEHSFPRLEQI